MTILIAVLAILLLSFLTIRAAISAYRTYEKAKSCVILKSFIQKRSVIISLICAGIAAAAACVFFSKATDSQNAAKACKYTQYQLRSPDYAEKYTKAFNDRYGAEHTYSLDEINTLVENGISENSKNAAAFALFGTCFILIVPGIFVLMFGSVFYITESGFIARRTKEPDPVTASRFGEKIILYRKPAPDRTEMLIETKATSENLNILGKFIEVDIEQPEI